MTLKSSIQSLGFIFLLVVIVIISAIAVITIFDIDINYFNINPSEKVIQKKMVLIYPNSGPPVGTFFDVGSQKVLNSPLVSLDVVMEYSGILSEETPVEVRAQGFRYPGSESIIRAIGEPTNNGALPNQPQVLLGFEGASNVNRADSTSALMAGQFYVPLDSVPRHTLVTEKSGYENEIDKMGTITWAYQGDYYPYIQIIDPNTNAFTTTYFPEYRIHITGSDVSIQNRYARINTYLTICLFLFTVISSLQLAYQLIPDETLIKYGLKPFSPHIHTDHIHTDTSSSDKVTEKKKLKKG